MIKKNILRIITAAFFLNALLLTGFQSRAASFDANYYANHYPDVVSALGTDPGGLYNHYVTFGMNEGRIPFEGASPGEKVDGLSDTAVTVTTPSLVPLKKLANYKSLKKKMTDEEFQQAYNAAYALVSPIADMSRQEQLSYIYSTIRARFDSGQVVYSTEADHYNDPYGYFVTGVGSCAGCTRATELCLNILGIPYEHVNENQWSHQWCRVPMDDGTYWICDAYGLYCGAELVSYMHPRIY